MVAGLKNSKDVNKLMIHLVRSFFKENISPTEVVRMLNRYDIRTQYGKVWRIGNFNRWAAKHNLNYQKIVRKTESNDRLLNPDGYSPEVNVIINEFYGKEPIRVTHQRLIDAGLKGRDGKPFSEMDSAIVSFIAKKYLGLEPIVNRTPPEALLERIKKLQGTPEPTRVRVKKEKPVKKEIRVASQLTPTEPSVAQEKPVRAEVKTENKLLKQVQDIMNSNLPDATKLSLTQTLLK